MGLLARIFEPIVQSASVNLDDLQIVAFDTNGTLVHKGKGEISPHDHVADPNTSVLLRDLLLNQEKLGLEEIVIISGDPKQAQGALIEAGLGELLKRPVEDRMSFYNRAQDKKILAVDNEFMLTLDADAYVNPTSEKVRRFIQGNDYPLAFDIR